MTTDATFRAFPQFNLPERHKVARLRHRVGKLPMDWFDRGSPADRIARALGDRQAIHLKELLEAGEFHERTRKRLRAPDVADLCCGHGLVGLLFACERKVERVLLLDRKRPAAFEDVFESVCAVFPEVRDKVRYVEASVERAAEHLAPGSAVLAVHACGVRTDRCLDAALAVDACAIAAMACCYAQTAKQAPKVLRRELGVQTMTDVHRTYRLDAAGYDVDWSAIPAAITPMNRILIARKPCSSPVAPAS